MDDSDIEVIHEEIIVHPNAERTGRGWKGEARIMGTVVINGQTYTFERVVTVFFKRDL